MRRALVRDAEIMATERERSSFFLCARGGWRGIGNVVWGLRCREVCDVWEKKAERARERNTFAVFELSLCFFSHFVS